MDRYDPERAEAEKERKREKKIYKVVKRSAIAFGAGIGFIFIIPFLPDVADAEKMEAMRELFVLLGKSISAYGAFMAIAVFVKRDKILLIDGLMNWLIVPTFGLWIVFEAVKILNG